MTTPAGYALTLSLDLDQPLDPEQARAIGDRASAATCGGQPVMTSTGEIGEDDELLACWTVMAGPGTPGEVARSLSGFLGAVQRDLDQRLGLTVQAIREMSVVSTEELRRQAITRERSQLVGVEEFREMLARPGTEGGRVSRSWFYELMGQSGAPKPVRRGRWTRHQAEAFAAEVAGRPSAGRPPRSAEG